VDTAGIFDHLTNADRRATKFRWLKAQGLEFAWDAYANSMDLDVHKPDARIYKEAMRQAGVPPAIEHIARSFEHSAPVGGENR